MTSLGDVDRFGVKQKITMMVNRYEIRAIAPDGSDGELLAFAQQKRLAFKEKVTFYADQARTVPLFTFTARQRIDLGATYDVTDAHGAPLGWFRKEFGKSLLRSSWQLGSVDGLQLAGQERNQNVAIARRLWQFIPWIGDFPAPFVFHFDFVDGGGNVVLTSERKRSLRDRYTVTMPGRRIDPRLAAAMAVALDALQSR